MKKIYTLIATALACAGTASAQQLPNNIGTFDGTWEKCYPNAGDEAVGTQPIGWGASNVHQVLTFELISQKTDRTAADDNMHSVHMYNRFCGAMGTGATAPAYITLGDAWNYGDYAKLNTPQDKSDGGSYGGINFTNRPDAVSLWVKRSHASTAEEGTVNADEKATVLLYSWKGETKSTVRIGLEMTIFGNAKDFDMTNRDKDVLGMITDGVTKSEDFELISKSENYIEGNIADWTQKVFDINYLSESTPEKLNIVIACSDYFNRPNLGVNNTLDVDDVALVYYSTLSKLTIGGSEIALTDDTYEYAGTGEMPTSEGDVVATTKSKFAETKVTLDTENSKVIITVTNQGGADLDGKTSHTYTITYPAATAEPEQYDGYINAVMNGGQIIENQSATVTITENGDGTCTFLLPNFSFDGAPLGDIKVENVTITEEGETKKYTGEAKGLVLGGEDVGLTITADVTLSGTITGNEVDFKIDVVWTGDGGNRPIDVTFTSGKLSSVEGINAATAAVYGTTGAIAINGYVGMAQVYNMGGTLVASRIVDGDATIDVTAGIYIVRIDGTNVKVIVK